jgi:hypothetical protein
LLIKIKGTKMKSTKITMALLASLLIGSTNFLSASSIMKNTSNSEPVYLSYYGQVNSNGTVRTKRVNGYYKSNGTYVNSYYRS